MIISWPFAAIVFGVGLLIQSIHADTLEFVSPSPDSKITAGDNVTLTYKIHYNGMAKLLWAKIHFMTEDGFDTGMGTINTAFRAEWQDSMSVSTQFKVPVDMKAGKYIFHVYGSTEQPCEESTDRCEGVLSEMLPVEVIQAATTEQEKEQPKEDMFESLLGLYLRRRSLYARRDFGVRIGRSDYLLEDGTTDTKKMLYFFSLI
ncbi:hypothetical protein FBU30_011132 [Linnemannia zychae]|nr:hypothetical protein FBU30_011132 [Linnemannia zychae]